MSLRTIALALVTSVLLACGGSTATDEPTTAKDKQRREAEADGEAAGEGKGKGSDAGKWGGWRYTGDRNECFFVVGRRCFKTEEAACTAARCGKKKCEVTGGGPASVACAK